MPHTELQSAGDGVIRKQLLSIAREDDVGLAKVVAKDPALTVSNEILSVAEIMPPNALADKRE